MHSSNRALQAIGLKLGRSEDLTDSDFYTFLSSLDCGAGGGACEVPRASSVPPTPLAAPGGDGAMRLLRREAEVGFSEHSCRPASVSLREGGSCTITVQSGPPQRFSIGRDVEDCFLTPSIAPGAAYTWTPPEPGQYRIRSELYPRLESAVRVLDQRDAAEVEGQAAAGIGSSLPSGTKCSSMAGVEEFIRFPLLHTRPSVGPPGAARRMDWPGIGGIEPPSSSQATQTGDPGAMLTQLGLPAASRPSSGSSAAGSSTEEDGRLRGVVELSADGGLRRRGRAGNAPHVTGASSAAAAMLRQTIDASSLLSTGSAGSPRSGSGSERSAASAPLYVQRRVPGGTLSTTRAYSVAAPCSAAFSDGRSSEEAQPLLYSVGRQGPQQLSSYGSGAYSYQREALDAAGARAPKPLKCPRCRKEYLSSINQRRCISSHLGGTTGRAAAQGGSGMPVADAKQLAEYWDGLEAPEKREVMDIGSEPNSEHIVRQLEAQLLHRKRDGQLEGLTREQRRLHTAGSMLHQFYTGTTAAGAAAGAGFSGSNLVSVLNQVSEGTFLCGSNTINRAEFSAGNNLEAGLGALVTKRLVDARLRAKQRDAERLQQELEDQEAAQAVQKGRQQQQPQQGGAAASAAPTFGKKKGKGKGKGKAAPAGRPGAASRAVPAAAASDASLDAEAAEDSAAAAEPPAPVVELPAALSQQASSSADGLLSPPGADECYGDSPPHPSTASSSFTNFLFAAEEAGDEGEGGAEQASGWRTAGGSRPSSRASRGEAAPKASAALPAAAPSLGGSGAADRPQTSASKSSAASQRAPARAAAERSSSTAADAPPKAAPAVITPRPVLAAAAAALSKKGTVAAAAPQAAPPAPQPRSASAAAAAAPPANGKLPAPAALVRQAAPSPGAGKPTATPRESFPALPAAASSKATAAAKAGRSPAAAPAAAAPAPAFSYAAAAAKAQKEASKPAAARPKAEAGTGAPVAGSAAPAPAALPVQPAIRARQQHPAAAQPTAEPAAAPAAVPEPAAAQAADTAVCGPASHPAPAEQAAATAAAASEAAAVAGGAAEEQRCVSVTPPISDAGSPPPGAALPPPPGAYGGPPHAWVGPDGMLMAPGPPMAYYWPVMLPPGMQFGSVDMQEVLPPAPYPPFHPAYYHPGPYQLPLGHPGEGGGGPLPPIPHMAYALPGGEGQLAPFPPGMPVPLPPEAADELAAAAAAGWLQPGTDADAEGGSRDQEEPAANAAQEAAKPEDSAVVEPEAQQSAVSEQQQTVAAPGRRRFLEMLQEACGPQPPHAQPPAASSGGRGRGPRDGRRAVPCFDAAAAAAEFERRWRVAAPQLAAKPATVAPAPKPRASALPASKAAILAARSGSGNHIVPTKAALAAKAGGLSSGGTSGRNSPANGGGPAPVVVAVRAWSSDDSVGDAAAPPRWKIHSIKQGQHQ